jgi:multisubunit Na+/H+ antiporter MnhC subunit
MVHTAFFVSALSLVLVGLFGILTKRNLIRILLALNILATGVNLFLVAVGYAPDKAAPIIRETVSGPAMPFVDPLPQAMVLTAIVIGLGTTALALAITIRHYRSTKSLELTPKEAPGAS